MFNLYPFNFYPFNGNGIGFQDPVLESELNKCKTQKERDEVVMHYQVSFLLGLAATFVVVLLVCGAITLIKWACN